MILLIGSEGYIGRKIQEELSSFNLEYSCFAGFITSHDHALALVEGRKPDIIINAAGIVGIPNVDACEQNKNETLLGNVSLPVFLASVCEIYDIPLLHVSSGCIYTGYKKAFTEDDEPNFSFSSPPCSFYSGTKALAEKFLQGIKKKYILRLRVPFDEFDNERNYLTKIQKYDKLLNVENSITNLSDLVEAIVFFCRERPSFGTYNIVNTNPVTTKWVAETANKILKLNKNFTFLNEKEFEGMTSAPRSSCVLDNTKLLKAGFNIRNSHEAVIDSLERWVRR